MSASIQIEMEALNRRLENMRKNASNPNALTGELSTLLLKDVQDHFNKSQGPSNRWASISHRSGKPLIDQGNLRRSLSPMNDRDTASVVTNMEYAAIHNFGGKAGRNRMVTIPQRKFMWISDAAKKLIGAIAGRFYIGEAI